jgi:hypothetical protein
MKSASDISTSLNLPQRYSTYYRYLRVCLTLPVQRGIHDINLPFAFRNSPGFIFHDSPGFETGDKKQLKDVQSFLEEKAKSTEVDDQLHAIWSVSLSQHTYYILSTDGQFCGERFCFVLNNARPLLPLETEFFETARAGNGFYHPVVILFQTNTLQCPSSRYLPSSMI